MRIFTLAILTVMLIGVTNIFTQNHNNDRIMNYNSINSFIAIDSIPADFPNITIDTINKPAPGYIFLESIKQGTDTQHDYLMILDNLGKPYWYFKPFFAGLDFKMQPNGLFSYCIPTKLGLPYTIGGITVPSIMVSHLILDSKYNVIDTIQCSNDYLADFHDFVILPNGNYLLLAYENIPVDMSKVMPGGDPNSVVIATVIQELDRNKKCVYQWRIIDHIPVTETLDNPFNPKFELGHANSMFIDNDGNMIVSLPTTCEIIKIDMVTGNVIWRMGGANSDIKITGDHSEYAPYYFKFQHDVKRLRNGNLLFFDNGVQKDPEYSRAVEYTFDDTNKTANLLWEYRHNPDIASKSTGNVQRLPNGNTLIDWGIIYDGEYKTITEVNPDNSKAFEMSFPSDYYSYRANKYTLPTCQYVDSVVKEELAETNTYKFQNTKYQTGVIINPFKIVNTIGTYNEVIVKKYDCSPLNPKFDGEAPVILPGKYFIKSYQIVEFEGGIKFLVPTLPQPIKPDSMVVYYRPKADSGTFIPLPTYYNIDTNIIVARATSFGEFIIGFPRTATEIVPPTLVTPFDKKLFINDSFPTLSWSPAGRYDSFRYQLAEDSSFNKILIDSSNVIIPLIPQLKLTGNKTYYWRAKTFYRNLESAWSKTFSFSFSTPVISILKPNGGEIWGKDTIQKVIRWKTNIPDPVSIVLYRNGVKQSVLIDSLVSYTNAYSWSISKTIPDDTTYTIKVTCLNNSNLSASSYSFFTIGKTTSVEWSPLTDNDNLNLIRNYPNPFSIKTTFDMKIEKAGNTSVRVFDNLGNLVAELLNSYTDLGIYHLDWIPENLQSGVYYCKLTSGEICKVMKFIKL